MLIVRVAEKTVIDGLVSKKDLWRKRADESVWDALEKGTLRASGDGSFIGKAKDGMQISGWIRGGKVDTFFPDVAKAPVK